MKSRHISAEESYGITSQFRHASTSIALNIAEGYGSTNKNFNRNLRNAYNSLKECVVCCTVAFRQKLISEEIHRELSNRLVEISKMISGLRKYLNTSG